MNFSFKIVLYQKDKVLVVESYEINCIPLSNNIFCHLLSELSCLPNKTSPIEANADKVADE